MSYICIEGNIGAGKTTFAKRYAELTGRTLILEQFTENPFLASFYANPKKHAFALEMSFLAERFQQLNEIFTQPDLFSKGYISDYSFYKTRLFAKINLTEGEFHVFDYLYQILERQIPTPDKLIYLHSDVDYLKENILNRQRVFEDGIKEDYLQNVQNGYLQFIKNKSLNTKVISYSNKNWHGLDQLIIALEMEISQ